METEGLLLKFYLAGPIGDVKDNSYKTWRDEISKFLKGLGHESINPLDKYNNKAGDYKTELEEMRKKGEWAEVKEFMEKFILPVDKKLLKKSDVIIAYVPEYTVGTMREIALSYEWKKPILVITPIELPANSLIGMATKMFKDFGELKQYIWEKTYHPKGTQ